MLDIRVAEIMEAYGIMYNNLRKLKRAAAGAPLRAAGASPSSVTETAIWKHSFSGTPLALHEVISSCRKTPFEEIDGNKHPPAKRVVLLMRAKPWSRQDLCAKLFAGSG